MQSVKRVTLAVTFLLLVIITAGCATNSTYEGARNFIEPSEVGALLSSGNVIVIDARGEEAYSKGHLDTAISLAPSALTKDAEIGGLVADQSQVEQVLSNAGIKNQDTLLIYDDNGGVNAGRVWWVLKLYGHEQVKIINGGAKGLERAALKMSAEAPKLDKTTYTAKAMDTKMIATLEDVMNSADETSSVVLLDVRSSAEFDEGFIPGAIHYSHTENLYNDGTFKSMKTIALNYRDLSLHEDDEIILYCKSSFRATQTMALLEEAGFTNVRVYDGAWLEWQSKDMAPAEKPVEVQPSSQDAS
ncbi:MULTISPECIES: sulfurtransferase [unclassified Fusibacter]|uniref:sulfurtransferase n=1 Tax=unclassified Fusibacter TaxID=2624464 RepID=UPI0010126AE4|nr:MULTISPECIES: rhodanese-like domain-containing protein [unclassified Fusibacter]MCK8058189.1 rhodanese-like domain-containing protein [Fusibacter sp. A2]NPE20772.1 sulfurtransferase [Fusibacter sp. A1]RXV62978.1 sulfurtransferase [Fusibacter sp. A1]